MTTTALMRVRMHNKDGLALDDSVNDWVVDSSVHPIADAVAVVPPIIGGFYQTLSQYWGRGVTRTAPSYHIDVYDLTGHLDGSPHGSPVGTFADPTGFTIDAGVAIPAEAAACISYTATGYTAAFEHGPEVSIQTRDSADDVGAPVTHLGKSRPRAHLRGRVFLGPLTSAVLGLDTFQNALLAPTYITAVLAAETSMRSALSAVAWPLQVWSRVDGAVHAVEGGWMDNRIDVQRRRRIKATARTVF